MLLELALLATQEPIEGETYGLPNGVGGQNDGDRTGDNMLLGLDGSINGGNGPVVSLFP
jgi:hypothetical protein